MRFIHETLPQRVVFAPGDAPAAVAADVAALKPTKVMLIAASAEAALADRDGADLPVAVRHDEVVMHVPVDVADRARKTAIEGAVDALVCVGGGSTTGLAKAVALATGLPIVAVPTTYAGSEATNVWPDRGRGENDRRRPTGPAALGRLRRLVAAEPAGGDVRGQRPQRPRPLRRLHVGPARRPDRPGPGGRGHPGLAHGLPAVAADPTGLAEREQTLYGAYLAAVAFASAGSGMHHKICHVLGGMFNLPHAQTHAVVLPHVLAFNAPAVPESERRIAEAFGSPTACGGAHGPARDARRPAALRDYGMPEDGIHRAVAPVLAAVPDDNPTPVTAENLTALLRAAWEGSDVA